MITLIRPVGGFVSSVFGMRGGVLHAGVDLAVGQGTPIHAAALGTVTKAEWYDGYGNYVSINHGGGISTAYGHMMQLPSVKAGQQVMQGQTIGYVGMTGDASGPHLHFEVRINGGPVDPWPYINGKAVPSGGAASPSVVDAVSIPGADALGSAEKFAAIITDRNTAVRVTMFLAGSFLLLMGLVMLGFGGSTVKKLAKKGVSSVST